MILVSLHSQKDLNSFQDYLLSLKNAGQKYCRMLQGKHCAILSPFIKLPAVIKIFVYLLLSGRFTLVLLYIANSMDKITIDEKKPKKT